MPHLVGRNVKTEARMYRHKILLPHMVAATPPCERIITMLLQVLQRSRARNHPMQQR